MQIKIGDIWYDGSDSNTPIMIVLSEQDKENIANMPEDYSKYCIFRKDYWIEEEIKTWMNK